MITLPEDPNLRIHTRPYRLDKPRGLDATTDTMSPTESFLKAVPPSQFPSSFVAGAALAGNGFVKVDGHGLIALSIGLKDSFAKLLPNHP